MNEQIQGAAELLRSELMKRGTFLTVDDSREIAQRLYDLWNNRVRTDGTVTDLAHRARQRYDGDAPDLTITHWRSGFERSTIEAHTIKGTAWLAEHLVTVVDDKVTVADEALTEIRTTATKDGLIITEV